MNAPRGRILAALAVAVVCCAAAPPVRVPSDAPHDAVAALGAVEGLEALAVSDDGLRAAVAIAQEGKKPSVLRLAGPDGPEPVVAELPGRARSLVFGEPPVFLYAIVHRAARRGPGTTSLVQVEVDTGKILRGIRLPATASSLTLYGRPGSLLVASRDELRSFRIPEMTSGPLFRVPGDNRSAAWRPGTHRVAIGQDTGVIEIDLEAQQDREGMPVLDRVATAGPVVTVAVSPDGDRAVLRLEGGATFDLEFDPLRLAEDGSSLAMAWPGAPEPAPEEIVAEAPAVAQRAPEPATPEPAIPREAAPEPALEAFILEPSEEEPSVATPEPEPVTPEPDVPREEPTEPVLEAFILPSEESPRDERGAPGTIGGTLTGEAATDVASIVVMGPDSVIVEAARVEPDADGRWSVEGLAPGRYRVLLDGGGARVVVSEPPFHTATVGDEPTGPLDFRVLRSL